MFLDDMDFGFEEKAIGPDKLTVNCIEPVTTAALVSAGAGIVGSLFGGGGDDPPKPKVLKSTISNQSESNTNFLFDEEATEAMDNLVTQLNDWSTTDRDFFENTFQPFQANLMEANQQLIPGIVANSGEAMEQSLKDLVGGYFINEAFRNQINQSGGDVSKFAQSFSDQIDNIPSADQRMGEAIAGVEQRFGEAGKELKKQMGAQGLNVSQASQRDLAIEKAKAKAGAVGVAAESARKEQLTGAQAGVGVAGQVQQSQSDMLATQQNLAQTAAGITPQLGGVEKTDALSGAGQVGAELTQTGAVKVLGQGTDQKGAQFTQKGVVAPKFYDKETGELVDAAGNPMPKPKPQANYVGAGSSPEGTGTKGHRYPGQSDGMGGTYDHLFGGARGTSNSNYGSKGVGLGDAIGGVSDDRDTDRSGSDGFGGPG